MFVSLISFPSPFLSLPIVQYLIEKGANIEAKDGYSKNTPLHLACENNHLEIVEYLIEKGANIETKDTVERTPLHIACERGQLPIFQFLVEKGANIEAKDFQEKHLFF